jgi:hypothetical protein
MLIVLIVLALAIVALVSAAYMYESNMQFAVFLLATGVIAMGLSVYVLFQSRKRVANMKIEAPKVMTTIECKKCNFKSVREFKRGDFVFKNLEPCEKCNENKLITAIYKEVKEKEKTYGV